MTHSILRFPQVIKRTGLSRSSIYLRMTNNEFPESVSLGGRAVSSGPQKLDSDLSSFQIMRPSCPHVENIPNPVSVC